MNEHNPQATQQNKPEGPSQPSLLHQHHSKAFKTLIVVLAELILLLGAFALGINVGSHKAGFTYSWEKNYSNNFPAPTGGNFMVITPPNSEQMLNAHGLDGTILSLSNGSLIIKDEDNTEKTILLDSQTSIRENFQTISPSGLKTGEEIVVLGDPNNNGQVQAKFIRVLDQQ